MSREKDVWGAVLADVLAGKSAFAIVERDDGFVTAPFERWDDPVERRAMRFVRRGVLDVGCGGGRVCLHLQGRGLEVVGVDSSPGAVDGCRQRGVRDARPLALDAIDTSLGSFDTIVFLGQNFGMLGSRTRARRILTRLARVTTSRGRIVAETFEPARRRRSGSAALTASELTGEGRMAGQLRVRIRYRDLSTPWLDWLQVSPRELTELLDGTD